MAAAKKKRTQSRSSRTRATARKKVPSKARPAATRKKARPAATRKTARPRSSPRLKPRKARAPAPAPAPEHQLRFEVRQWHGRAGLGRLIWDAQGLDSAARSGSSRNCDCIPAGLWEGQALVPKTPAEKGGAFCDALDRCWFLRFVDAFDRTAMGIHPDDHTSPRTPGTEGCIGIEDRDTAPWRAAFAAVDPGTVRCHVVYTVPKP